MFDIRLTPGRQYKSRFKNYRGEFELRHVVFVGLDYVQNRYYPEPAWCMRTYDIERGEPRSFGLHNIEIDTIAEVQA